jgi:hypothetical protein
MSNTGSARVVLRMVSAKRKDGGNQAEFNRVGFLAAMATFVLKLSRVYRPRWTYIGAADRFPGFLYAIADCAHEAATAILHQVPAVRDLDGLRESAFGRDGITAASVTGHETDVRLARQPNFLGRRFPIGQKGGHPPQCVLARANAEAHLPGNYPVAKPIDTETTGSYGYKHLSI